MIGELGSLLSAGINLVSGVGSGWAAWRNRGDPVGEEFEKSWRYHLLTKYPGRLSKLYDRVSPALEHFVWGYAPTSFLYFMADARMDDYRALWPAVVGAAITIGIDIASEVSEKIDGGKFRLTQILTTAAGTAASYALNNMESIDNLASYLF